MCVYDDCSCDSGTYLQIFIDGESGDDAAGGYHLCGGRAIPSQVTTTNPRLLMIFHAQGQEVGHGFSASYQFITGQSLNSSVYICLSVCLSVCVTRYPVVQYH